MAVKVVPLDYEPEPLDEEQPTQAIPAPEDTPPSGAPPTGESPAPVQKLPTYTLPDVPPLPVIQEAPKPEAPKPVVRAVPMEVAPTEEWTEPKPKEADSWTDPKDYAVLRGAAEGLESIKGGKDALTVLDLSFGGKSDEEKLKIILEQPAETAPSGWERREPSISGVGSLGEFSTWFQESAGSAVTSTAPSVIGSMAGAAGGGALAGPVGALVGGYGGAAVPSMMLGLSGMYQDMRSNEGVRQALQNGTITVDQFQKLTMIGGLMSGALDSIPAAHWGGKALGLDMAKKAIRDTIIKAAIKGGLEEGATESLQQIVSEGAQSQAGGDTGIGQQALNVLDAGLQGLVGGLVFGGATRGPKPVAVPKVGEEDEETAGQAGQTKPESGVVTPSEEATNNPPGDVAATTPKQPAGAPATVTTEEAKPEVAPAEARPGVTVVQPGQVPADAGAALGGGAAPAQAAPSPVTTPVAEAIPEDDTGEFDIAAEVEGLPTAGADIRAHEQRIADMLKANSERVRDQERRAASTQPAAATNADVKAALAAATEQQPTVPVIPPVTPPVKPPVTTENIGTGRALQPEAATIPAPVTDPVLEQGTPPADLAATREPEPLQAPAPAAVEESAPLAAESLPVAEAAPKVVDVVPMDVAPLPLEEEAAPAPVEAAAFVPEQKPSRVPGKIQLKAPVAVKGEALKRRVKGEVIIPRKATEEAPGRAPVAEAPVVGQEAERAPTPAAASAKAVPTNLSRGTAGHVRDMLDRDTVSELPEFHGLSEEIAAAHVRDNPRGDRGTQQYFDEEGPKIAAEIKTRLAEAQEAHDAENIKAKELLTKYGRKQHAKEARAAEKAEKMATAEKPQEAERAGKKKGKSAAGIRAESKESTYRAYKKELAKPPEKRSAALLKWGQLHEQQTKLPKTGTVKEGEHAGRTAAELRAEIQEQKDLQQEARAVAAELEEAKGPQLTERARQAEKDSIKALESIPMPEATGSKADQVEQANEYFDKVDKAQRKLKLADHIDTGHQSAAENLMLYARKIARHMANSEGQGQGPTDFMVAKALYDAGAIDEMDDMIVSQSLKGGGYSEHKGEGPAEAWTESEDEGEMRQHEQEDRYVPSPDEEFLMRRGGRNTAWQQAEGQQEQEAAGRKGWRTIWVTRPDGSQVQVEAETHKASSLLRDLNKRLNDTRGGFFAILRNAHIRHLMQLVGQVDVHFVSARDIAKFGKPGARGLYLNYSDAQRTRGMRPQVFIDADEQLDLADYAHTLLHEMTHAATSQAIRDNVRGSAEIIHRMRLGLEHQLLMQGIGEREMKAMGIKYGFTNDAEFIAEAFSNEKFQELLAGMTVPPQLAREIAALGRGKPPTWWQAFTATVSHAIGMISGTRGQTYMEQVLALSPHITRSSAGQQIAAREAVFGRAERPLPRAVLSDPFDAAQVDAEVEALFRGVKDKLTDTTFGEKRRWLANRFASTDELIRRATDVFGGINNVFEKLANAYLKRDALLDRFRKSPGAGIDNEAVERANFDLKRADPVGYGESEQWMDDATRWQVNGAVPLSHADNGHISKAGQRSADARAMHKELAERFAKMTPEVKKVVLMNIEHYRRTFEVENDAKVRYSLRQVLKGYHKKLPAGKTIEDAIKWVRSGAAARLPEEQDAEDKAWHEALGNTAKTLAKIPELRRIKGVYAPMQRKGRYFITAKERHFGTMDNQKNVPAGAVMDAENRLLFANRKDYDAFVDSFAGQVHGSTKWVDKNTGKTTWPDGTKVHHKEINAARLFVATVQNQRMEMSDSLSQLKARAAELAGQGHQVAAPRISKKELYQAVEEISAPQIKALLRNFEQTTLGKNTSGQEAIKAAVLDAQIRMLNTPGRLERHLKRRNVLGNQLDMAGSLRDYNRSLASGLAHYELAPELAEADNDLENYINSEAHKDYSDDKTMVRQQMASELRQRIRDTNYKSGSKLLKAAKDITALRHLASPHYSIINSTQPYMVTMPILSAKYGRGVAWRELSKVLFMGGVRKTLGKGFKETWNAGKAIWPGSRPHDKFSHDDFWRDLVKGEGDAALLHAGMDRMIELGFGPAAGIELSQSSEADMGRVELALHRIGEAARALPQAVEANNRYLTLVTTLRLAKLKGLDDAAAIREAVLTVGETQGGYNAANNPAFFNNPWLAPAVQFKKFGLMYGQLFYRNLAWSFSHADPEQRKIARKSVARLSLMSVAAAGAFGLPFMEIARSFVNVAALLGLKDDDWEKDENDVQKWVGEFLKQTGAGEGISEALFRGAPRIAGLDLSGSLGTENLLTFGQPKTMDIEGLKAWGFDMLTGASGGVLTKSLKSLHDGDIKGAIPLPKFMQNIKDAYDLSTKGTTDKKTGEQYMEPINSVEAVYKGLGLRTASEAREWETGGGGFEQRVERQERARRRTLMGQWSNAEPKERTRIFRDEVKAWNKEHRKQPDMRIDMDDLFKSREERQRQRKEREKERQK